MALPGSAEQERGGQIVVLGDTVAVDVQHGQAIKGFGVILPGALLQAGKLLIGHGDSSFGRWLASA